MNTGIPALDSRPFVEGKVAFTLETARALLSALDNPQDKICTLHVAGTNGKGSVCANLAAILNAAGKRTGLFTSPHLGTVNERCVIDGTPVKFDLFRDAVNRAASVADANNLTVSFFELTTAASFLIFAEEELDCAVIETGLGGRFDATNCIKRPKLSVITGIDFDHVNILGNTLAKIAAEKAGIIKPGVPVVVGPLPEEAALVIQQVAAELGSEVIQAGQFPSFAQTNAEIARAAGQVLGLSETAIERGLETAFWPGRFERTEFCGREVLLDVAHNPQGVKALLEAIGNQRCAVLLSVLKRKDWRAMLKLLEPQVDEIVFTSSGHPDAVEPEELRQAFGRGAVEADPEKALVTLCQQAKADDLVVITGSTFLVGKIRNDVLKLPFRTYRS